MKTSQHHKLSCQTKQLLDWIQYAFKCILLTRFVHHIHGSYHRLSHDIIVGYGSWNWVHVAYPLHGKVYSNMLIKPDCIGMLTSFSFHNQYRYNSLRDIWLRFLDSFSKVEATENCALRMGYFLNGVISSSLPTKLRRFLPSQNSMGLRLTLSSCATHFVLNILISVANSCMQRFFSVKGFDVGVVVKVDEAQTI